jgi:nucleoid DNA-binding protein
MKTGEPMKIPARNIPKFKSGKQLKEAVAKGKGK